MTLSPAAFMASAPKPLNGNTAWAARYANEIRRVFHEHAAQAPRSLQLHLGPSELGVECDRQVAGKMAGCPTTNHVFDPWPSIRGTALHAWAADAFTADNVRKNVMRWVAEQRVTPHPDHPGTADLYDAQERSVDDHKFLGESSLAKVRSAKGPSRQYRVQLHLYGLGYRNMGLPVDRVVLLAYPATAGSLDGLYVWEQAHRTSDIDDLLQVVFEQTATRQHYAREIHAGRLQLSQVPSTPDSDLCYFCPFYRPQSAKDGGVGCPGTAGSNG
ncbi:hypothetical protein SAMN05892883_2099 [Jatrophihabitans sp. GAS493]|uniref:hypothetical protein n=1 Tax=Jatrophihabitans sp. GAS493 TaxID=1907575 RepID=UPI000BB99E8D|nr:hypothetical protein [Jatrophihabitans sp. GAS493]SOD72754.1 hypothetical protein SAMN05892883_2099 [Jatrophihabitans sp. GAS493]